MVVTDAQVVKLRAEMTKTGSVSVAGMRAGMSRNTAAKYLATNELPSEMRVSRAWRTRLDPFEEDWASVVEQLGEEPGLEAKTLFEDLERRYPGRYQAGQLRTLQRRVKQWRASEGPDKELFLPQIHRPGEAMQTDFTWMNELKITIAGEEYKHLLCHCVLPYSNWSWATPCLSESLAAFRKGVPAALRRLGRRPKFHQTDNSTGATHSLQSGKRDSLQSLKRTFNDDYKSFMEQLGMDPRTIAVGKKEQNGDVEAANGALKRFLEQQLLLRGSRDFESHNEYVAWLTGCLDRRNQGRSKRLEEDLAHMQPLKSLAILEYTELTTRVTSGSTVSVKKHRYSVPSRLCGEQVRVRIFDDKIEIYYGGKLQVSTRRLRGKEGGGINYRHIVNSLLRKPGGFRNYRYYDDLFPTETFRRAFEVLDRTQEPRKADIEYLRILRLAAITMESAVEEELKRQLETHGLLSADDVRDRVAPEEPEIPEIDVPAADLSAYDELLMECVSATGVLS